MRNAFLVLLIVGMVLLIPSLLSPKLLGTHPSPQVTAVPTVYNYVPLVAKNWPPTQSPAPVFTNTPPATPSGSPTAAVTTTPTSTPTVGILGAPPFGVDMSATGITAAGGLDRLSGSGSVWVRVAIGWSFVEGDGALPPDAPTYNWGSYDAWLSNAANAGLTPIVIVGYPVPRSYRASGWESVDCGLLSPVGLGRYADFLSAAAERYDGDGINDAPGSPVVKYWELGNEPDRRRPGAGETHFGLCYGDNGDRYAELLKTAWDALHSDPDREVYLVFGGMAYEDCCGFNSDPLDRTAGPDFLDTVLDYIQSHPRSAGAKYFDTMNYHGYRFFVCDFNPPTIVGKANVVRNKLASHGLAKPLMLTEAGWWSDALPKNCGVEGSLERESRYVVQVFVRSMSADFVSTVWFAMTDLGGLGYGLLDSDLNPKPAYWAFKTMTDELAGYSYSHALSDSETGPSDIEGFVFTDGSGEEKWVLWTRIASTDIARSMSLRFESIRVVQKEKYSAAFPSGGGDPAAVTIIDDGGPGDLDGTDNGKIRINITASPIYIALSP